MTAAMLPLLAVLPLLASSLLVVWRQQLLQRILLVGVPLGSAIAGVVLLVGHHDTPVVVHQVGGFVPGVAIAFVSDTFTALMLAVTGLTTAACAGFLILTGEDRYRFVPPLVLMLVGGVNGALLTGDLFNLFVFIEVMLLPSYALIAVTGSWLRLGVGRLFVMVNLLTSTILLMGVGFVYAAAGTVNLAQLAGAGRDPRTALALGVVLLALCVKAAVVPVHGWLPRSYPATSAGVMALFSGLHTKVALYAVYRVVTITDIGARDGWASVLAAVVIATMLVGALSTYGEQRIRSALAFQMVSGVGHILLGVVVATAAAFGAGIFYLAHHVVTMGALLLVAGAIEETYGSGRFDRLGGLMRRDRPTALVFAIGLLSLVGLPPTSGLWGKFALVRAVGEGPAGLVWPLIAAIVGSSLISLMALQRVWVEVFWSAPLETYRPDNPDTGRGAPLPITPEVRVTRRLLAPGAVLMAVSVGIFVLAGPMARLTDRAGEGLADPSTYVAAVLDSARPGI